MLRRAQHGSRADITLKVIVCGVEHLATRLCFLLKRNCGVGRVAPGRLHAVVHCSSTQAYVQNGQRGSQCGVVRKRDHVDEEERQEIVGEDEPRDDLQRVEGSLETMLADAFLHDNDVCVEGPY